MDVSEEQTLLQSMERVRNARDEEDPVASDLDPDQRAEETSHVIADRSESA